MEMRELGKTGLRVSRLGLGLAALGRPGYINIGHAGDLGRNYNVTAMRDQAAAVLDAAWQAGVRYFDAARSYGRAEEFLAHWLTARRIPPEQVTVGSKWGYTYTAGWRTDVETHEVKAHTLENLTRQLTESRAILGPYLKLYQIHSATPESGVLENRAVLDELALLRPAGLRIGLSVSGPRQAETIRKAIEVRVAGRPLFDCVQATWNLLERSVEIALAMAHSAGMGVIIKEALANGRLTNRNTEANFTSRRRILQTMAQEHGVSMDALALAGVLARPWVDVVLSGATTTEQLNSNLTALAMPWPPELDIQLESLTESPDTYWRTRAELRWN